MDDFKFDEAFAQFLAESEIITPEQALDALDLQRRGTTPIGRLALDRRLLTMKQIFAILAEQNESGLRFGEQAIFMDFLERPELEKLLAEQQNSRPDLCAVLSGQGVLTKRELQKHRRTFIRSLETVLV